MFRWVKVDAQMSNQFWHSHPLVHTYGNCGIDFFTLVLDFKVGE